MTGTTECRGPLSSASLLLAADAAVTAVWGRLPVGTRRWLEDHRSTCLVTIALLAGLNNSGALLITAPLLAYACQPRPRRPVTPLVPAVAGLILSIWVGSAGGDLGLVDVSDGPILVLGGTGISASLGLAAVERAVRRSQLFLDPVAYGIPAGILLGRRRRSWVSAPPQVGALVIGPPRSGKTSGVVVPNVMAWRGPVVTTTTRHDVLDACAAVRLRRGTVWCFDPMSTGGAVPAGVQSLHWSPLRGCREWDVATQRAVALMAGTVRGTEKADHWRARGAQLLGALLHAAAVGDVTMSAVCDWIHAAQLERAERLLELAAAHGPARDVLAGIASTPDRERGSIWSAVAGALAAFDVTAVRTSADASHASTFDPDAFLDGDNTLFIVAPADQSVSLAPLVVGLVEDVRVAALRRSDREGALHRPLLLALDEVANISPLPNLLQIASEGGGRNILLLAALQDLSQASDRWGTEAAAGLLTLAGAKLFLPGIADTQTLERVETLCGKHWVTQTTRTMTSGTGWGGNWSRSKHYGLVQQPRQAAAAIRELRPGTALAVVGNARAEVIDLATHHRTEPFAAWAGLPLECGAGRWTSATTDPWRN